MSLQSLDKSESSPSNSKEQIFGYYWSVVERHWQRTNRATDERGRTRTKGAIVWTKIQGQSRDGADKRHQKSDSNAGSRVEIHAQRQSATIANLLFGRLPRTRKAFCTIIGFNSISAGNVEATFARVDSTRTHAAC